MSGSCQSAAAEGASGGACIVRAEAELRSSGDARLPPTAGESSSPVACSPYSPDAFDLAEVHAGRCLMLTRAPTLTPQPRVAEPGGGVAGGVTGCAHAHAHGSLGAGRVSLAEMLEVAPAAMHTGCVAVRPGSRSGSRSGSIQACHVWHEGLDDGWGAQPCAQG